MTIYDGTIAQADQRAAFWGADLMDHVHRGWHEGVNLDRLDINSSTNCVLGQTALYGHYSDSLPLLVGIAAQRGFTAGGNWKVWHEADNGSYDEDEFALVFGFVPAGDPASLDAAWAFEIYKRREP